MSSIIKDADGSGPSLLLLPTGEQQILVRQSTRRSPTIVSYLVALQVACRIRPMTEEEILQGATIVTHKVADDNVSTSLPFGVSP